jgi:hypothetical protein
MTRTPASPDAHDPRRSVRCQSATVVSPLREARHAGVFTAVLAAIALLAAACSGSPSSHGAQRGSTAAQSSGALAFSRCMRSHGVPNYTDPDSSGALPKGSAQDFGVSNSQFQAAQEACAHLLPATSTSIQQCETTGDCPQAVVQQALNVMRKYARCIRAHGVPNWPDPTIDSEGRPLFDVSNAGITYQYTHSQLFESKDRECERLVGGSAGVPVPLG